MDDSLRDVIHSVSKTLCGARLRLSVAIWIRGQPQGAVFYQRQIAEGIGTDASYVRRETQILQQLGMITPRPPARSRDVRRFYQADQQAHDEWTAANREVARLDRIGDGATNDDSIQARRQAAPALRAAVNRRNDAAETGRRTCYHTFRGCWDETA